MTDQIRPFELSGEDNRYYTLSDEILFKLRHAECISYITQTNNDFEGHPSSENKT